METKTIRLNAPFDSAELAKLKAGDRVEISGVLYTARDAAHKRLVALLEKGEPLPFDIDGQGIYYVGPCVKDGRILSAGPTTSYRMDAYAPALYERGLAATIGKGDRSEEVYRAIKKSGGVYFAAIGGAGALYAACVTDARILAYEELGAEAVRRLVVKDMPVVVAIDSNGDSVYRGSFDFGD